MKSQRGSFLVETIVVMSIFSVLGLAILRGIQTSYVGKRTFDIQSTAENLIRNQMESVFGEAYTPPGNSYTSVAAPDNFSVSADAVTYDITSTDVETVRVTVSQNGQPIKVTETLRANR